MSKVWSERELGGKAVRHEAKRRYQRKEMELEQGRQRLSRMEGELRSKREGLARSRREIEKRQLEILNLERQQRTLTRSLEDFTDRIMVQKRTVARLEHEAEQLREEVFRGGRLGL